MPRPWLHSRLPLRWVFVSIVATCIATIRFQSLAESPASADYPESVKPSQSPEQFVRDVLTHEVEAQLQDHSLWRFYESKVEVGKRKLFYVCQTKDGQIERLIAVDDQPLDPQKAQAEDRRIQRLLANSNELQARRKKEREDGEHARRLLKLFPDAFRFQVDGNAGKLVRVTFVPNPQFHPSGHTEQVFHHMEGTLLLDPVQKRLAAIDGRLTSEVKFAGGLLGHLDKGGTFDVRQQDVGSNCWEVTAMKIQMIGKALFFKTINVRTDEQYRDYRRVPEETNLSQAVEILKQNRTGNAGSMSFAADP
jgi:hypothetical protein